MEKLKVTHRAELRKRRETAESTVNFLDDTVERTAVLAATPAKKRLVFTTPAQCSPVVAVSLTKLTCIVSYN